MTKSLHSALTDLKPARIWIIHAGDQRYALHEKVEAIPLQDLAHLAPILAKGA